MLQVDPKDRIDIAGILSHPWFGSSMKNVAISVNQGLLEMPDSMLTGKKSCAKLVNINTLSWRFKHDVHPDVTLKQKQGLQEIHFAGLFCNCGRQNGFLSLQIDEVKPLQVLLYRAKMR